MMSEPLLTPEPSQLSDVDDVDTTVGYGSQPRNSVHESPEHPSLRDASRQFGAPRIDAHHRPEHTIQWINNDHLKNTDRGKGPRSIFPCGDVYFQNVRSRGVVILSFVFVFDMAVNFALNHYSYETTAINLSLLLAFVAPMMATFPDAGSATLAVGWMTMSAYHGLQLYLRYGPDNGWYMFLLVSLYCTVQQFCYLRMAIEAWSPKWLAVRFVAANGEQEALEMLAYTRQLWRWSSPDYAMPPDALREKYATSDPSDNARYSSVRRFLDRWIDIPFVAIPVVHEWAFPRPMPAISIVNPTQLPLMYVVVQWCTLTVMVQLAGNLVLPPGPWTGADVSGSGSAEVASLSELLGISEWQLLLTAAVATAFCLCTMTVLTHKVRAAVNNVQRGVYNRDTKLLTAPWRVHKYIGQQMFANLALLVFTLAIALLAVEFARPLWDLVKNKLFSLYFASWSAAFLQRVLFARVLCDKTSVRHYRLAVAVSHVIALLSIVGGLADLSERALWCFVSLVVNFAVPIDSITGPRLVFLDHLHRSLWSLIYLNNDCCHPVKQVMAAAFSATEELVFLQGQHAANAAAGTDTPEVDGLAPTTHTSVYLKDVGNHLMMPIHRHLVRYFILKACRPSMSREEAFELLRYPEKTMLTIANSTASSRAEELRRQRIVSRWWLLLVLIRRPSLALQRKHTLWSTTFATAPASLYM